MSDRESVTGRSTAAKVVAAVVVLALGLGVLLGVRWWTHPTVFGSSGGSFETAPRPLEGAQLAVGVTFPTPDNEAETLSLDDARAVLSENTAEATVTFSICHLGADETPLGGARRAENHCADLEPLEAGASFLQGVPPDTDYLIAIITPTRPGVVRLARVDLDYRRGPGGLYQRGTEELDFDILVNVT